MIFLVMLIACSLLIDDAAQMETYKPYYDMLDLNTYDKKNEVDDCETRCGCPQPTPKPTTQVSISKGHDLSQKNTKFVNTKRSDETSPQGMETVYSIWRRDDLSYPAPIIRNVFG